MREIPFAGPPLFLLNAKWCTLISCGSLLISTGDTTWPYCIYIYNTLIYFAYYTGICIALYRLYFFSGVYL